ncbi:peptidoglycan bridge formation protein FemAB [Candidatus Woesebacteria bacterium]|nr:peptidoglycan bridge formation protein FemAB [Candidatus Woesebacteria bacterium]
MTSRRLTQSDKSSFDHLVDHPIQSWQWGSFREKTGIKVIRAGTFDNGKMTEGYQITIHTIPYTNFKIGAFFKGPEPTTQMLTALKNFGKEEGLILIRMEPNVLDSSEGKNLLRQNGAVSGRSSFTKETFLIDLTKSEEELLKNMHSKTRYNIRVAERHGVEVAENNSDKAFEEHLKLMMETTKRQGFYAHSERYHRLMWEVLAPSGIAHLLQAKYKEKILVSWIVFVWGNTLYYPYGASSGEDRNVMAAYGMMWEAIKFGKQLGLSKFDLWGKEEGKGFTKFKEGFGPQPVEFIGTWDLPISPILYPLYRITEKIWWIFLRTKAKLLPTI